MTICGLAAGATRASADSEGSIKAAAAIAVQWVIMGALLRR